MLAVIALAVSGPSPAQPASPEDLVFVTEQGGTILDGCCAISAFSIHDGDPLHRGWANPRGPARLAANSNLTTVLAAAQNGSLYVLRRLENGNTWTHQLELADLDGSYSIFLFAGIAVMPDDETLLLAMSTLYKLENPDRYRLGPPYWVSKRRLSELQERTLGPERGRFSVPDTVAEILPAPDGRHAHLLTTGALVLTLDVSSMAETSTRIQLKPIAARDPRDPNNAFIMGHAHATLSTDGRFLVTNRWDQPELNVADLLTRQAWTLHTGNAHNGGLAINRGWINTGLLALHTGEAVKVYRFLPPSQLEELASLPVTCCYALHFANYGPQPSVAWSADCSHLIAAVDHESAEFLLIQVRDDGQLLVPRRYWTACPHRSYFGDFNHPADILTANGLVSPPTPTATPTSTRIPTPTSTTTATPLPSPTATRLQPLYLPLLTRYAEPSL